MYKPKGNCLNLPTLDFSEKTNVFWHRINLPDICLTGAELKKYVSGLGVGQVKLFNDNFSRYRWGKIRHKLGLDDFKFHDLRKTFGSVLAQNGVSTAVTQKLLEHSSPDLTNKVYTNVDPVLRSAVDQIPVDDWL